MVNVNKLKGKIVECGMNVEMLAEKIGIDRATLYRKMSANGEQILIKEADVIARELNLNIEEAIAIFFAQYVA